MSFCLLVQPIDEVGCRALRSAGLEPRLASAEDMTTVAREIPGAVAAITRNAGLSREAIAAAADLLVIGNHGTGYDPIDIPFATSQGIPVVHTPEANVQSVAELAVGLTLAAAKHLPAADRATRRGDFGFKYHAPIRELAGKTAGIIGFGRIGRLTAAIFKAAFGMRVLVYSPSADPAALRTAGFSKVDRLVELLAASDVVSLHVPLTPASKALIGEAELARLKPSAILINTSRGAVVDEPALIRALEQGKLAAAGLDVYANETMSPTHPLLQLENVILTPHIGGSSKEALERTARQVVDQVTAVLQGERPTHLVNPEVWHRRRHS
ncbi:MAG: hydroxyacid dehydrogenase [Trueperaceae bacterium]|nr:MAG: hydroxyacid dehydrogenase [Trueperaceae bacterium]